METASATTPGLIPAAPPDPLRLDLGCGTKKKDGFLGVDKTSFPGVDVVCDLGNASWPWPNDSVDEVHCSHMLEHLWPWERIHFVNELYRVLKPGGKAFVATPHWNSMRAAGDLSHVWPPVYESWPFHLQAKWRAESAPHENHPYEWPTLGKDGRPIVVPAYTCDFDFTAMQTYAPDIVGRNPEWWQFAMRHYSNAASDLILNLQKPFKPR